MKLVLTTYDSVVCSVLGYMQTHKVMDFTVQLQEQARQFAELVGVSIHDITWEEVRDSDWCKNMIVLYCYVPQDWVPVENTFILDEGWSKSWFPNTVKSVWHYLHGRGSCINQDSCPPTRPHNLYRTIEND